MSFLFWQDLDEPGKDTSKFDVFAPTVVKPKTASANPRSSIVGLDNSDDSEVSVSGVQSFYYLQ